MVSPPPLRGISSKSAEKLTWRPRPAWLGKAAAAAMLNIIYLKWPLTTLKAIWVFEMMLLPFLRWWLMKVVMRVMTVFLCMAMCFYVDTLRTDRSTSSLLMT